MQKISEPFNIALGFVTAKILNPLIEVDMLLKVARYGVINIENTFAVDEQTKTKMRIDAIKRLVDILRDIIDNSYFACKKEDKEVLDDLEERILKVAKVIQGVYSTKVDSTRNIKHIEINEEHFNLCLEHLRQIKRELSEPLNRNSLIFRSSDEVDLATFEKELVEGG